LAPVRLDLKRPGGTEYDAVFAQGAQFVFDLQTVGTQRQSSGGTDRHASAAFSAQFELELHHFCLQSFKGSAVVRDKLRSGAMILHLDRKNHKEAGMKPRPPLAC
jgi:hypothetical protein